MKKVILCFIALICLASVLKAQNQSTSAKYDLTKWKSYNKSNSPLPDNYINTIELDGNGDKWLANYRYYGILKFDGTNWTIFNTSNSGIQSDNIRTICFEKNGIMWIGSYDKGLAKYDGTSWSTYDNANSGLPDNGVSSITFDSNGIKWIGTYGGGLAKFDGTNWTIYNISNSGLTGNIIYSIAIEANGTIWVGTQDSGLAKYDGTNWIIYNKTNSGLPDNNVTTIAIDGNGIKWFGTHRGIAKFDGKNWSAYFTNYCIEKIIIDDSGTIWIATFGNGFMKFDGKQLQTFNTANSGILDNNMNSFVIDRNGTKWIATFSGVSVFNENGIPTSVRENKITKNDLKIFPNPVNDYLNFDLPTITSNSSIEIINMQGKLVKCQRSENNRNTIDVKDLSGGVYIIKAITEKGIEINKFIKE